MNGLWLLVLLAAGPPAPSQGEALELRCGEFVAAVGQGESPRWRLTGNLRAIHRDTPRLSGARNLIEGCMAPRLDPAAYARVFRNGYEGL
ncbi:MAG TPA: hypothetical protein PKZ76_04645 [Xanthomonadaceae bacterium]|nr:hypothetical protein [Xanthomonadaceae bacterium]